MDGGALRARYDVADADEALRVGQRQRLDPRTELAEPLDGRAYTALHLRIETVEVRVVGDSHAKPGDGTLERVIGIDRTPAGGRVAGIVAGDDREHERGIGHRPRHRPDVIERPRQRHGPGPAHPPVRRLQPDDAAARGGQANGAAGVGTERSQRQSRGHGGGRAAPRSAGDVTGAPWVLHVAVVGIVAEGSHGELRHVELAEGDGTGGREPGHRRALVLIDEVLPRARPARRRQPADVTEILVRQRNPVQRSARGAPGELLVPGTGGGERPLPVDGDEAPDRPVQPFDTLQAGTHGLDGRDAARPDGLGQRDDGPVGQR